MKAPAFDYVRAGSLDDALSLLRRHGDQAKIIAGGQSLIPALNLRLLAPSLLVDIGPLEELRSIAVVDSVVQIGALTRYVDLQRSPDVARHVPLVAKAVAHIGHAAIRNRGTIGGNLAHADPASELPACALALGARMIIAGADGERSVAAQDFFRGLYETALAPDEVLVRVDIPSLGPGESCGFAELARRSGDYAVAGLAAHARIDNGTPRALSLAYFGVGLKPTLAAQAAEAVVGRPITAVSLAAAEKALATDLDPQDDLQASAPVRLHLARVLLRRVIQQLQDGPATAAGGRSSR